MAVGCTRVVQITNIAPQATKDQMQTLFGYLGKIEDIRLYPTIRDVLCPVQSRICYVKFMEATTVGLAQHMTNTVFIDRALIVIPVAGGEIPDEYYALELTRNGAIIPGFNVKDTKMPSHVTSTIETLPGSTTEQTIVTHDPQLEINGLLPYPPLPASYDAARVEECRRTLLIHGIEATSTTDIIDYIKREAGADVKYLRPCEVNRSTNYWLIEFSEQPMIVKVFQQLNGAKYDKDGGRISVYHATQPIIKPQTKTNEAAQREIEEAMSRFKEAQNLINASIEPVIGLLTKDKRSSTRRSSRSRSRSHRRSSHHRSSRSRSRRRSSRTRSRSKTRRRRYSRSRSRRRSRTPRSRSRSRTTRRHRSRSRSSRKRHHRKGVSKDRGSVTVDKNGGSSEVSKRRVSRSPSHSRRRSSRSKEHRRDRRRSKSRGRRRSPTTPPRSSRRRGASSHSRSRERSNRKKERKHRNRSRSKSSRSKRYDDEKPNDNKGGSGRDARTPELLDKRYEDKEEEYTVVEGGTPNTDGNRDDGKDSPEKSGDNMDISNSP